MRERILTPGGSAEVIGMTCWRRLRDWQEQSIWDRLHVPLLTQLRLCDQIDWSRAALTGPVSPAPGGPNPTAASSAASALASARANCMRTKATTSVAVGNICNAAAFRPGLQIARRGVESSQKLGRHRWVVERTHAWFAAFGKLCIRFERRMDSPLRPAQTGLFLDLLTLCRPVLLVAQSFICVKLR